ncbi:MAG: putative glycoside hydrolase, partial [bacterium]|nr:putative glycoside hydrolase [bacterium]
MSKDKIFLFLILILVIFIAFALDVPRYFFEQRGQFITGHLQNNNAVKDNGIVKEPIRAKGIYVTYRTASNYRMEEIIDLIKRTELNSVVIDIKDYTGRIPFQTESDLIHETGSEKIFIKDIKGLIENLHKEGIYTIARIAVFEDDYLPREKPELALKNSDGSIWHDNKGLAWLDPASKEVWNYTIAIAKEVIKVGFDEINLDYIRFPSDGATALIKYPFWDKKTEKTEVIRSFFEYFNH